MATDLFSEEWHDHDYGRELSCTSVETLWDYLLSGSATEAVISEESSIGIPSAKIRVIGPRCDDGRYLTVSYKLTKSEFSLLGEKERMEFIERLHELMNKAPSWRLYSVLGLPK